MNERMGDGWIDGWNEGRMNRWLMKRSLRSLKTTYQSDKKGEELVNEEG